MTVEASVLLGLAFNALAALGLVGLEPFRVNPANRQPEYSDSACRLYLRRLALVLLGVGFALQFAGTVG